MKGLRMIACVSADRGIGKDGDLLWHIKPDMQFFRDTTMGHPVIMGGTTYRSLGRPLPGRENIVLTRGGEIPGVRTFPDRAELDRYLSSLEGEKFIIGGAALYRDYLDQAEVIYLTEVAATKPADTFFPEFDRSEFVRTIIQTGEHNGVQFETIAYHRKEQSE